MAELIEFRERLVHFGQDLCLQCVYGFVRRLQQRLHFAAGSLAVDDERIQPGVVIHERLGDPLQVLNGSVEGGHRLRSEHGVHSLGDALHVLVHPADRGVEARRFRRRQGDDGIVLAWVSDEAPGFAAVIVEGHVDVAGEAPCGESPGGNGGDRRFRNWSGAVDAQQNAHRTGINQLDALDPSHIDPVILDWCIGEQPRHGVVRADLISREPAGGYREPRRSRAGPQQQNNGKSEPCYIVDVKLHFVSPKYVTTLQDALTRRVDFTVSRGRPYRSEQLRRAFASGAWTRAGARYCLKLRSDGIAVAGTLFT